MSDAAKKLLDDALGLPADERRRLARQLLDSVRIRNAQERKSRWARLWTAAGGVRLGGNALEDTEALYDG